MWPSSIFQIWNSYHQYINTSSKCITSNQQICVKRIYIYIYSIIHIGYAMSGYCSWRFVAFGIQFSLHVWTTVVTDLHGSYDYTWYEWDTRAWYIAKLYVVTRYGITKHNTETWSQKRVKVICTSISLRRRPYSTRNISHIWTFDVTHLDVWSYISGRCVCVFSICTRVMLVFVINELLHESKCHAMRSSDMWHFILHNNRAAYHSIGYIHTYIITQ